MPKVIDTVSNMGPHAEMLARADVSCVMRYYNRKNVNLPEKRVTTKEAQQLAEVGISLAVVFQQRGGSGGHIKDFYPDAAATDAKHALALAKELGQTKGSAIYFAVDHDFVKRSDIETISAYFKVIRKSLGGKYRLGAYGSGKVLRHLFDAGLIDLAWLSQSTGWTGYRAFVESLDWALLQGPAASWPVAGFGFDPNKVNPAFSDFGQFDYGKNIPAALIVTGLRALYQVNARTGLNLRRGPDADYDVVRKLAHRTVVEAIARNGDWVQIDDEGDGVADGYMHGGYLDLLAGGVGQDMMPMVNHSPYGHARRELLRDVVEVLGSGNNPRVMQYHASTDKGAPDAVPWCSSFVNWCVLRSGLTGTDSKWAMSWHDDDWGRDVTKSPQEGDIVVYQRSWTDKDGNKRVGGHVGFFVGFDGSDKIALLGGNQSNRVSIAAFPKTNGKRGSADYKLLSIRRPLTTGSQGVMS